MNHRLTAWAPSRAKPVNALSSSMLLLIEYLLNRSGYKESGHFLSLPCRLHLSVSTRNQARLLSVGSRPEVLGQLPASSHFERYFQCCCYINIQKYCNHCFIKDLTNDGGDLKISSTKYGILLKIYIFAEALEGYTIL